MAENAQVQEINTKNTNDQNEEEGNYLKINTKSEFDIYYELKEQWIIVQEG